MRHLSKHLMLAILLLVTGNILARAAGQRPNFIFIISDDQRWDALSAVQREQGERGRFPWLQTPNMDRLASGGVRFRNAFVTTSLCSPSRASMLTSTYNHQNGILNNSTPFPPENETYATIMREAGYKTGFFGKFHHGTQRGPRPGFEYNATFIDQGIYHDCPFEVNGEMVPTQGWVEDVTIDFAIDFLKQHKEDPFSIFIGFKTPHEPTQPPERHQKTYKGAKARVTPNMTVPAIYRLSREDAGRKQQAEKALSEGLGVDVHLNYFRCITAADESLGRLLDSLDELNLFSNTVVVYTSDNGFYLGEHCLGDKRSAYEESLRVPLIIRYPGMAPRDTLIDEMALNIDIAPTFLEMAGVPVPSYMQGRSLLPLLRGDRTNWRTGFIAEYFIEAEYPNTPTLLAYRTDRAKLVKYPGYDEWTELFDLTTDPYEINNLAGHPDYQELLATMTDGMEREAAAINYHVPAHADKATFNGNF